MFVGKDVKPEPPPINEVAVTLDANVAAEFELAIVNAVALVV